MLLSLRPACHCRAEQAEIAVSRPAAGDPGAEYDVMSAVRRQKPIKCHRTRGVPKSGANLAQIHHAIEPAPVARYRSEVVRGQLLEFGACVVPFVELDVD